MNKRFFDWYEAENRLDAGKKVRNVTWPRHQYIEKDSEGYYRNALGEYTIDYTHTPQQTWEEYKGPKLTEEEKKYIKEFKDFYYKTFITPNLPPQFTTEYKCGNFIIKTGDCDNYYKVLNDNDLCKRIWDHVHAQGNKNIVAPIKGSKDYLVFHERIDHCLHAQPVFFFPIMEQPIEEFLSQCITLEEFTGGENSFVTRIRSGYEKI